MKIKLLFTFTAISLFSSLSFAQSPNWLWAKSAGGNANDKALSIAADTQGNTYVTGYFYSSSISFGTTTLINRGMFLTKYNSSGNVIWAKDAVQKNKNYLSGGYAVALDNSRNIYVAGQFYDTITFGTITLTQPGIFIVKYDSLGNILWAKDTKGGGGLAATAIVTDNFGNFFVAGNFIDTLVIASDTLIHTLASSKFIAKYDTAGNPIWAKGIYTSGYSDLSVAADKFGNVCIAGDFGTGTLTIGTYTLTNQGNQDIFAAKFNPAGNVLWAKSYGNFGDDEGTSIATDTLGNISISGFFDSPFIAFGSTTLWTGGNNIFIVKNDGAGNTLWAKGAHGNNTIRAPSIKADKSGNAYVAGYFSSSSIIFDATDSLINKGMFLAKYDPNGNFKWGRDALGGSRATAVTVDAFANPYVAGYFSSDSITFDSSVLLNDTTSSFDIFVATIDALTGIEDFAKPNKNGSIFIYPNPSNGKFTIQNDELLVENYNLEIYNIIGAKIYSISISNQSNYKIDISSQPKGIYFVKIKTADGIIAKKIILIK